MFKPKTVLQAVGLAKLQEENHEALSKKQRIGASKVVAQISGQAKQPIGTTTPIVKKLTQAEMKERRDRGLCYNCDERYTPGHRCKRQQIFMLDLEQDGSDGEELVEPEQQISGESEEPQISVHALSGSTSHQTMRIRGYIKRQPIIILIDSGSTHNFLDPGMAKRPTCEVQKSQPLKVVVADGGKVTSMAECKGLKWVMQGTIFQTDVKLLPLGGCDLVLGIQWLATLGPAVWDFSRLRMEFTLQGRKHTLRGGKERLVKMVGSQRMNHILKKGNMATMAQLFTTTTSHDDTMLDKEMEELLSELSDVFNEPSGLPPPRAKDHRIPLRTSTSPVNVRPYRYPYVQKNEIERLMKEMLEAGIVWPSTSPFSSPIILVRKKDGLWRVSVDPTKISSMTSWPKPKTLKALRGFLGLTGYYGRFVKNYGKISKPLTEMLKKDSFKWSAEAEKAFEDLKTAVTSIPVLALPDFSKPFMVECDASGVGIGGALAQNGRPIAFTCRALSSRHRGLSTYEKELMAVVHAVTKWRQYLVGRRFQICTDHLSLKFLLEQRVMTLLQQKWLAKLLGYDYEIIYWRGKENLAADALS
ncbi:uncharacterized protein LOC143886068 [Tasmannia lanceolata]|uniref:uncharacterized protein LOC143886068 n=1 Tax=Tasmannia lanceolata TaxID=3420 RepID=UPI004062F532